MPVPTRQPEFVPPPRSIHDHRPQKIKVNFPVGLGGSVFDFSKYPMPNISRRRQTKPNRPQTSQTP